MDYAKFFKYHDEATKVVKEKQKIKGWTKADAKEFLEDSKETYAYYEKLQVIHKVKKMATKAYTRVADKIGTFKTKQTIENIPGKNLIEKVAWVRENDNKIKGNAKNAVEKVEYVANHFPTDWTEAFRKDAYLKADETDRDFFISTIANSKSKPIKHDLPDDIRGMIIYLSGNTEEQKLSTAFHELGHFVEHEKEKAYELSKEFIEKRTKFDDYEKLNDIFNTNEYKDDEVVKKDDFLSPYIGKYYQNATESLSMGMEGIYANRDYLKGPVQYVYRNGEVIDVSNY